MNEIKQTIKSFSNNTPGITNINKTILENIEETLTKLQWLFNHTPSMGYFPDKFKTALIKFIPKENGNTRDPFNYRPISLLEVTGEILKKILNNRLRNLLEEKHIFIDSYHGLRKHRGTNTAITTIYETAANLTPNNKQCYMVLRDVSKAFDKVWIQGLQYKFSRLDIPDITKIILNNFLLYRKAQIK